MFKKAKHVTYIEPGYVHAAFADRKDETVNWPGL